MKIIDIYNKINKYRQLDDAQDVYDLIWEIDRDLYDTLLNNSKDSSCPKPEKYIFGEDDQKEALVSDKCSDLYMYYVLAHYDFIYQDTESYTNNMLMYNNMLNKFRCEFRENHRQKTDYKIKF